MKIPGGLADKERKTMADFSQDQIIKGVKVEKEHVKSLPARIEITLDHLTEKPNYYNNALFKDEVKQPLPIAELKQLGKMYAEAKVNKK